MTDLEKRALKVLATEYRNIGDHDYAEALLSGRANPGSIPIAAIVAALQQAQGEPETVEGGTIHDWVQKHHQLQRWIEDRFDKDAEPQGLDAAVEAGVRAAEIASDARLSRHKVVRAIIAAAQPHLRGQGVPKGWRPIETAPRDGRGVLWGALGHVPQQGHWANGPVFSSDYDSEDGYFPPSWVPTHWMPLPAPPITAQPGEVK